VSTVLKNYVYGHWHIALCASVLYLGSTLYFNYKIEHTLLLHVFFATMFIYTAHRLLGSTKMTSSTENRYTHALHHRSHAYYLICFSLPVAAITFFFLTRPIQIALIISGIISLGYIMPLLFKKRLRDIGVSKIILISMVWAVIPILSILEEGALTLILLLFAEHFFFIFALTLPFDVRDQELDSRSKVSNLANTLGLKNLRILLILCIILSSVCVLLLLSQSHYNLFLGMSFLVLLAVQLLATIRLSPTRGEMYYLFNLDGFILLKGLIYAIAHVVITSI